MENAKQNQPDNRKAYKQRLLWRKVRLYLLLLLAFVVCVFFSVHLFHERFVSRVYPQINRAISQISRLLPQLQANEERVRTVYSLMEESREAITREKADKTDSGIDPAVLESLSWMNRISQLKVGYDGSVIVVSKEDGTILAHPDKECIGQKMLVLTTGYKEKESDEGLFINVKDYKDLASMELADFKWTEGEELRLPLRTFRSDEWKYSDLLEGIINGTAISYGDTYIIVGVGMPEYFSYIYYALLISVIVLIVLWLFIKYICLHMDRHELRAKELRPKLILSAVMVTTAVLVISWYVHTLYDVSIDLKTMEHHAKVAVDTLDTYEKTQKKIDSWLDNQYLEQCRAAGEYLKKADQKSLTRTALAELAENLGAEYVFLYDKNGAVVKTNSPYDHFRLSMDPEKPSYAFRTLLQGVDHLVQPPMPEELSGEVMQYIGVSLRDENDLSNGFVQIAVSPELRNLLVNSLDVQAVLDTLVIGLPQHAVAIDKETMLVAATTGVGYVGATAEEIGITKDHLQDSYSGFLSFNGDTYYAGFGETPNYFLVPIVQRTREADSILLALQIAALVIAALALLILLALFHYDRDVMEHIPEPDPAENAAKTAQNANGPQNKWDFDKRWRISIPKEQLDPGGRIRRICHLLMIIFCLLFLFPFFFADVNTTQNSSGVIGLTYVLAGNWEKGFNIFAFTACVFVAFVLFIFSSIVDRILYRIAWVSDMRVETICLLLKSSLRYVVFIGFIYYGLSQFGIPSQALLASAGIVTLAISVGAKDFINDIIAGFFILIEGNFQVGDFVTIGNWYGFVDVIGIRTTKVSLRGETKIFNNSSIRDVINNVGPTNSTTVKIPIAVTEDLEYVEAVLNEELPKLLDLMPKVLEQAPYYDGVNEITTDSMIIRVKAKTKVGRHYKARRWIQRELKIIFDRRGIKIPYHQIDLRMAPDTENTPLPKPETAQEDDE